MTIQTVEIERDRCNVPRQTERPSESLVETCNAFASATATETVTVPKTEVFTARLKRATANRFLLSIPTVAILMVCLYRGFQWLDKTDIPWLQGKDVRAYAFGIVFISAWATMKQLEKIIRSFVGEKHFDG